MSFEEGVKKRAAEMLQGYGITGLLNRIEVATPSGSVRIAFSNSLYDIANAVVHESAEAYENAGYSGSHDDGGASRKMDKLKGFLEGVLAGLLSEIVEDSMYHCTLAKARRDNDPEYQKYLELKAKYGD